MNGLLLAASGRLVQSRYPGAIPFTAQAVAA